MNIDKEVYYIIDRLNKNNYEAFMVGGCVRDLILSKAPKDFDITTSAKPDEIKAIFEKTIDTGIRHGTVTVRVNKKSYEVTTYRIDGEYDDNRRPSNVIFTNSLEEDLARRDFTMNAVAYHPETGFFDPFCGRDDIENKIIRAVGDANLRFNEDALRMLRAVRFSAQLGFDIFPDTFESIKDNLALIKNLSIERIRDEFLKILLSQNFDKFKIFADLNFAAYIDADLEHYIRSNAGDIIKYIQASESELIIRLGLFFYKFGAEKTEELLKFLRLDHKSIKGIKIILETFNSYVDANFYSVRKVVSCTGYEYFDYVLKIHKTISGVEDYASYRQYTKKLEQIYENTRSKNYPLTLKQLDITGRDLGKLAQGKIIGEVLDYLMSMVLKYPVYNKKEILLRLAQNYVERHI